VYQKQGIASNLINQLEFWAKSLNLKKVSLSTLSVMEPAIKLYSKMGFVIYKTYELNFKDIFKLDHDASVTIVYFSKEISYYCFFIA
jgi:ribosomal protein S18 acetylase RimI-like enzyme